MTDEINSRDITGIGKIGSNIEGLERMIENE